MMTWFGKDYGAPFQKDCPQVPVPVGAKCIRCKEAIAETDDGVVDAGGSVHHRACFLRSIFGSVNHQLGMCKCHHPNMVEEPSRMTVREEAEAAVRFYESRRLGQNE